MIHAKLGHIRGVDFRRRFLSLLSFKFREFGTVTALSVLEAANVGVKKLDGERSRGRCVSRAFKSSLTDAIFSYWIARALHPHVTI